MKLLYNARWKEKRKLNATFVLGRTLEKFCVLTVVPSCAADVLITTSTAESIISTT